jgi:hypothetical protein
VSDISIEGCAAAMLAHPATKRTAAIAATAREIAAADATRLALNRQSQLDTCSPMTSSPQLRKAGNDL